MIKHIVFFKLEDNSDEQKDIVKERLMSLKDNVKVLKHIEVGINFSNEERAYDLALLTDFETKEDLDIYAKDEYHQEIIKFIKSVTISSKVVDYKY
jgi:hypothetical protein